MDRVHKLVGVQHFYLFNHFSVDNYLEVLEPYIKSGEVDLIEWHQPFFSGLEWRRLQSKVYETGIAMACGEARWLATIDSDEFLVPKVDDDLISLLSRYEPYGGLVLSWQMFGTSGVEKIPEGALMVETLTRRAKKEHHFNRHVKSIVHPHRVRGYRNAHCAYYAPLLCAVTTHLRPIFVETGPIETDIAQINHYWTRDGSFLGQKCQWRIARGDSSDEVFSRLPYLDEEEDRSIFRFIPRLRTAMGLPIE